MFPKTSLYGKAMGSRWDQFPRTSAGTLGQSWERDGRKEENPLGHHFGISQILRGQLVLGVSQNRTVLKSYGSDLGKSQTHPIKVVVCCIWESKWIMGVFRDYPNRIPTAPHGCWDYPKSPRSHYGSRMGYIWDYPNSVPLITIHYWEKIGSSLGHGFCLVTAFWEIAQNELHYYKLLKKLA